VDEARNVKVGSLVSFCVVSAVELGVIFCEIMKATELLWSLRGVLLLNNDSKTRGSLQDWR